MSGDVRYNAMRLLYCDGPTPHICGVPRISSDYGATGPVECAECGAGMSLVDVITVERHPTWGSLSFPRADHGDFYYTASAAIRGALRAAQPAMLPSE